MSLIIRFAWTRRCHHSRSHGRFRLFSGPQRFSACIPPRTPPLSSPNSKWCHWVRDSPTLTDQRGNPTGLRLLTSSSLITEGSSRSPFLQTRISFPRSFPQVQLAGVDPTELRTIQWSINLQVLGELWTFLPNSPTNKSETICRKSSHCWTYEI
jgi:hypothetical protein